MLKGIALVSWLATVATSAAAAPAVPLTPKGDWTPARSGNICILRHYYEEPDGSTVQILFSPGMMDRNMIIMVERDEGEWSGETPARLTTADGTVIHRASARTYKVVGNKWTTFIDTEIEPRTGPEIEYDDLTSDQIREDRKGPRVPLYGERLTIEVEGQFHFEVPTPSMQAYGQIMKRCTQALRADFGVTQDDLDKVADIPVQIESKADYRDYPTKMLRRQQQSRPLVMLWIESDGSVGDCKIVESSGHDDFDEVLCKIASKKTTYEPGLDSGGNPVRATYMQRFIFTFQ